MAADFQFFALSYCSSAASTRATMRGTTSVGV